mmetsp:Transcript_20658/g.50109  ORF Transcript_20658/g.50109 Transcript_20658/m.50109 type:complete len:257 (-) Transcript_20658:73-843(-)
MSLDPVVPEFWANAFWAWVSWCLRLSLSAAIIWASASRCLTCPFNILMDSLALSIRALASSVTDLKSWLSFCIIRSVCSKFAVSVRPRDFSSWFSLDSLLMVSSSLPCTVWYLSDCESYWVLCRFCSSATIFCRLSISAPCASLLCFSSAIFSFFFATFCSRNEALAAARLRLYSSDARCKCWLCDKRSAAYRAIFCSFVASGWYTNCASYSDAGHSDKLTFGAKTCRGAPVMALSNRSIVSPMGGALLCSSKNHV